jgi:hypothetical protein
VGSDYHNFQVFAGQQNPAEVRRHIIAALGYRPERQVDIGLIRRSIADPQSLPDIAAVVAVGPPGRWITVYDSWFGPEDESLAEVLSRIAPTVVVSMDDGAAVHFYLYWNGERRDRFANRWSVTVHWKMEEQREKFRGRPALWSDLLVHSNDAARLRVAWEEDGFANEILDKAIVLFGWHPLLSTGGYTVDHDGIPEYYREYVQRLQKVASEAKLRDQILPWTGEYVDLNTFTEFDPDLTMLGE